MPYETYDVVKVRKRFPALSRQQKGKPVVYLDGPGGSQAVDSCIRAISSYLSGGSANLHGAFATSVETEAMIQGAREAAADLLGGTPAEIVFGANMTTLCFALSRAFAREWQAGDEIVVTQMDHHANVDPWIAAAEDRGLTVRWLAVDPKTFTLNLEELHEVLNKRTRLVAVGLASNALGTINDVKTISKEAHSVGASVVVDGVHAVPHLFADRQDLGADVLLCSAYKFFGPHIGLMSVNSQLLDHLSPYKAKPAPEHAPDKWETGTQSHEGIAGFQSTVEFIAGLGSGQTRRDRIRSAFALIGWHEERLARIVRERLSCMPKVRTYGAPGSVPKTPTIAFRIQGLHPEEVCRVMAQQGLYVASGDFYASTLAKVTGVASTGGWVRIGFAPYTTEEEACRFLDVVETIAHP